MPYRKNSEIPQRIQNVLPDRAQTVWRKAFNNAHARFKKDPGTIKGPDKDPERAAIKVAWFAVKQAGWSKGEGEKWVKSLKDSLLELSGDLLIEAFLRSEYPE